MANVNSTFEPEIETAVGVTDAPSTLTAKVEAAGVELEFKVSLMPIVTVVPAVETVAVEVVGAVKSTVDDVAELSGQTRSSFLKRFGSKQGALEALFEKYCDDASATMRDIVAELQNSTGLHPILMSVSQRYEALLQTHKASNRAMH